MFLPQVLFLLSLITFPSLPFLLSLLCTMHNYLLELLGMIFLEFLNLSCSLFDRECSLSLQSFGLKDSHGLVMLSVTFSKCSLLGIMMQLSKQEERV
jgi:hypothetical protein